MLLRPPLSAGCPLVSPAPTGNDPSGAAPGTGALSTRLARAGCWLLGIDHGALGRGVRIALALCALAAACNAVASCSDVQTSGGTDLRARVVGSRALIRGLDPYRLEATTALPEALQDPHRSLARLSRCTYTPALLLAIAPLGLLPYPVQRALFAALEWGALLLSLALLARTLPRGPPRALFGGAALLLFAGAPLWRLHVERGQYYVFLLLLGALLARELLRGIDARPWALGAPVAALVLLRPNWAPLLVLLLLLGHRRAALGAAVAAAAFVALGSAAFGQGLWPSYVEAVGLWSQVVLGTADAAATGGPAPVPEVSAPDGFLPAILELRTTNLAFLGIAAARRALLPGAAARWLPMACTAALALCAALPCLLAWLRRGTLGARNGLVLVGSFLLLSDYLAPLRIEYADVLFLLPLALLVPWLCAPRQAGLALALLLALALPLLPIAWLGATAGAWPPVLRSIVVLLVLAQASLQRASFDAVGAAEVP